MYLEVLQHSQLILLTVQFKGHSEKSLDAVEPQAVICSGYLQAMKPECCNRQGRVWCESVSGQIVSL